MSDHQKRKPSRPRAPRGGVRRRKDVEAPVLLTAPMHEALSIDPDCPTFTRGTMVLAFGGWMDGGEVSTGTVRRLVDRLAATRVATIDPEGFYVDNLPGAMDVTAMVRPHVVIRHGLIRPLGK